MQPVPDRDPAYPPDSPTAYRSPRPGRSRQTTAGWLAMVVFAALAALGGLGAVTVVAGYFAVTGGLEDVAKLDDFTLAQESIVYDRTGQTELARFGEFKREIVTFQDLPPVLVDATTAVEDGTFWTNTGFDPRAIIAAGIDALRGNARGASTITQQLVRQRLLDDDLVQSRGRTAERKLKEIIQSIRLTKFLPGEEGKQQIIAAYLNQNFYGNNSYGVKAAARSYFGVDPKQLTLAQAAILAALPQSPSSYDLVRNAVTGTDRKLVVPPDTDIVQRRNQVLDLMASGRTPLSKDEFGPEDFAAAKREPVVLAAQADEPWIAPHFVWAVRAELTNLLCPEAETCDKIEQGGFKITTTIDLELQAIAEKWVKASTIVPKAEDPEAEAKKLGFDKLETWMSRLSDKDVNNGALVALDYETGELVAYVGSADYSATTGTPKFQPKFDVIGNGWRQPGSAFKPFNYLTGIDDRKMTAASMFMDVGTDFGGGFTPNDADLLERGPVRVRSALQFSLNIPSVKATAVNRPEYLFQRAQDFGMQFRTEAPLAGLAMGLGVQEVRPVDLVTAYGTIGNLGRYVPHTTILRVVKPDGTDEIPPHEPPAGEQVASPEAASIVLDILGGNTDKDINPFWGEFAIASAAGRRPAALKTGTNNDAKDLNAYGLIAPPTPEGRQAGEYALAVGVWNGNSDNTPVGPVFSIQVSTFVWQGFLREATVDWAINPLPRSDNLTSVQVDPWTGFLPAAGQRGVAELFIPGTEPTRSIGSAGGICGEAILEASEWETRFENWLAADRDWIARARRGPGVRGGPERTRTSYFYNNGYRPYGRSWGPILNGAGCGTPAPPPTCFPAPTPDENGIVPSFEIPTPAESGAPAAEPCPAPSPGPSPAPETPTPAPVDTPPPIVETPTPPPVPTPLPTPELITPEPPSLPPIDTPPPALPTTPAEADPGASAAAP